MIFYYKDKNMKFIKIFALAILSTVVLAQRKQRAKNKYGIEPETLEKIKKELIVENVKVEEEEEELDVFAHYDGDDLHDWENGRLVSENENW